MQQVIFYPFRVQLGREDAGKGILLQSDNKGNLFVMGNGSAGVIVDGDVRDMIEIKTKTNKTIIVVSKNSKAIQVLKTN